MRKIRNTILLVIFLTIFFLFAGTDHVQAAVPDTPKLISAQSNGEGKTIVKWRKVENADGYLLYRKIDGQKWTKIRTIGNNAVVSCIDNTVTPGKIYYYTVRAYVKTGTGCLFSGVKSPGVSVTTELGKSSMVNVALMENKKIDVNWQSIPGATGYRVFRKTAGKSWQTVTTIFRADAEAFIDDTVLQNEKYYYTVRAFAKVKTGYIWSKYDTSGMYIIPSLATPVLKSAKHIGNTSVRLEFEKVKNAVGYCIYKKENGKWVQKIRTKDNIWWDMNASTGVNIYIVRAYAFNRRSSVFSGYMTAGIRSDRYNDLKASEGKVDCWVGDSRTVHLSQHLKIQDKCVAKSNTGYSWYMEEGKERVLEVLRKKPTATIVYNFGVNDTYDIDLYIAEYKQMIKDYPRARILIMSINPIDTKYTWAEAWGTTYAKKYAQIVEFNNKMKAALPNNYIDTYTYLLNTGFDTVDGLHYQPSTSEKYYYYALAVI